MLFLICSLWTVVGVAQVTQVNGLITDKETGEVLSFVAVSFPELGTGVTTDLDGVYQFTSSRPITKMEVSYLGYVSQTIVLQAGQEQKVDVLLVAEGQQLQEVVVEAKKKRYKNKDNPAVTLIRKVRAARADNTIVGQTDYVEYGQYEKLRLDLTNIDSAFQQKGVFSKFDFLFDDLDSSSLTGNPSLSFFVQETNSTLYQQKSPAVTKEVKHGVSTSGLTDLLDQDGIDFFLDKMYQDIDIYDEYINVVDKRFVGPVSSIGPQVYRYYIMDTVLYNSTTCYRMQVWPRNDQSYAFKGDLFIDTTTLAITKVDLSISDNINLNFVDGLALIQIYTPHKKNTFVPISKELIIEFKLDKGDKRGIIGRRKVSFKDFKFDKKRSEQIFKTPENIILEEGYRNRSEAYWEEVRHEKLNKYEEAVYVKMDSLQKAPRFKRWMKTIEVITTGLVDVGPVSFGPLFSLYSFNSVEGTRLRLGVETNDSFSSKTRLGLYGLYGLKDKRFKYGATIKHSFNKDLSVFPRNEIALNYKHVTNYPGLNLQFVDDDNFFLSFKRGNDSQMLLLEAFTLNYTKEYRSNISFGLQLRHEVQKGYGALAYTYQGLDGQTKVLPYVGVAEAGVMLRYAPGQAIYEGQKRRKNIKNNKPIFTAYYNMGIKGIGKGDYNYHRIQVKMFKRFYAGFLGYGDMILEGGTIQGKKLPYTLLNLPEANQSFFYNPLSYNMMNFLEFTNQHYGSVFYTHFFEGLILNRIPLIKKLKWRTLVSAKVLYGSIDDKLNPNKNPHLVQFSKGTNNLPLTTVLGKEPYVEMSVGIYNIFKVFRVDFVKRVTYLDAPHVPTLWGVKGLGFRTRFKINF